MNFSQFTRILRKKLKWLILFPSIIAVLVYFLTAKMPKEYVSGTSVYTGIASGFNLANTGEGATSSFDYFAINNAFDNLMVTIYNVAIFYSRNKAEVKSEFNKMSLEEKPWIMEIN